MSKASEQAVSAIDRYLTYFGSTNHDVEMFDGAYIVDDSIWGPTRLPQLNGVDFRNILKNEWAVRFITGIANSRQDVAFRCSEWRSMSRIELADYQKWFDRFNPFFYDSFSYSEEHVIALDDSITQHKSVCAWAKENSKKSKLSGASLYCWDKLRENEISFKTGLLRRGAILPHGVLDSGIHDLLNFYFVAAYISFIIPSLWVVKVRIQGSPWISIITDPTGMKAFWKNRDVLSGDNRHLPLKHLVREHYRKSRKDPEAESYIRAHFRGSDTFTYKDILGLVVPSKDAIEYVSNSLDRSVEMEKSKSKFRKRSNSGVRYLA